MAKTKVCYKLTSVYRWNADPPSGIYTMGYHPATDKTVITEGVLAANRSSDWDYREIEITEEHVIRYFYGVYQTEYYSVWSVDGKNLLHENVEYNVYAECTPPYIIYQSANYTFPKSRKRTTVLKYNGSNQKLFGIKVKITCKEVEPAEYNPRTQNTAFRRSMNTVAYYDRKDYELTVTPGQVGGATTGGNVTSSKTVLTNVASYNVSQKTVTTDDGITYTLNDNGSLSEKPCGKKFISLLNNEQIGADLYISSAPRNSIVVKKDSSIYRTAEPNSSGRFSYPKNGVVYMM